MHLPVSILYIIASHTFFPKRPHMTHLTYTRQMTRMCLVLQMARDELPCDAEGAFKLACASVSHHARATGGRKFKVANKGTKLFDEAYR